jgi:hypothetical protein
MDVVSAFVVVVVVTKTSTMDDIIKKKEPMIEFMMDQYLWSIRW